MVCIGISLFSIIPSEPIKIILPSGDVSLPYLEELTREIQVFANNSSSNNGNVIDKSNSNGLSIGNNINNLYSDGDNSSNFSFGVEDKFDNLQGVFLLDNDKIRAHISTINRCIVIVVFCYSFHHIIDGYSIMARTIKMLVTICKSNSKIIPKKIIKRIIQIRFGLLRILVPGLPYSHPSSKEKGNTLSRSNEEHNTNLNRPGTWLYARDQFIKQAQIEESVQTISKEVNLKIPKVLLGAQGSNLSSSVISRLGLKTKNQEASIPTKSSIFERDFGDYFSPTNYNNDEDDEINNNNEFDVEDDDEENDDDINKNNPEKVNDSETILVNGTNTNFVEGFDDKTNFADMEDLNLLEKDKFPQNRNQNIELNSQILNSIDINEVSRTSSKSSDEKDSPLNEKGKDSNIINSSGFSSNNSSDNEEEFDSFDPFAIDSGKPSASFSLQEEERLKQLDTIEEESIQSTPTVNQRKKHSESQDLWGFERTLSVASESISQPMYIGRDLAKSINSEFSSSQKEEEEEIINDIKGNNEIGKNDTHDMFFPSFDPFEIMQASNNIHQPVSSSNIDIFDLFDDNKIIREGPKISESENAIPSNLFPSESKDITNENVKSIDENNNNLISGNTINSIGIHYDDSDSDIDDTNAEDDNKAIETNENIIIVQAEDDASNYNDNISEEDNDNETEVKKNKIIDEEAKININANNMYDEDEKIDKVNSDDDIFIKNMDSEDDYIKENDNKDDKKNYEENDYNNDVDNDSEINESEDEFMDDKENELNKSFDEKYTGTSDHEDIENRKKNNNDNMNDNKDIEDAEDSNNNNDNMNDKDNEGIEYGNENKKNEMKTNDNNDEKEDDDNSHYDEEHDDVNDQNIYEAGNDQGDSHVDEEEHINNKNDDINDEINMSDNSENETNNNESNSSNKNILNENSKEEIIIDNNNSKITVQNDANIETINPFDIMGLFVTNESGQNDLILTENITTYQPLNETISSDDKSSEQQQEQQKDNKENINLTQDSNSFDLFLIDASISLANSSSDSNEKNPFEDRSIDTNNIPDDTESSQLISLSLDSEKKDSPNSRELSSSPQRKISIPSLVIDDTMNYYSNTEIKKLPVVSPYYIEQNILKDQSGDNQSSSSIEANNSISQNDSNLLSDLVDQNILSNNSNMTLSDKKEKVKYQILAADDMMMSVTKSGAILPPLSLQSRMSISCVDKINANELARLSIGFGAVSEQNEVKFNPSNTRILSGSIEEKTFNLEVSGITSSPLFFAVLNGIIISPERLLSFTLPLKILYESNLYPIPNSNTYALDIKTKVLGNPHFAPVFNNFLFAISAQNTFQLLGSSVSVTQCITKPETGVWDNASSTIYWPALEFGTGVKSSFIARIVLQSIPDDIDITTDDFKKSIFPIIHVKFSITNNDQNSIQTGLNAFSLDENVEIVDKKVNSTVILSWGR